MRRQGPGLAPASPHGQTPTAGSQHRKAGWWQLPPRATHPPAGRPGCPGATAREQGDRGSGAQHSAAGVGAGTARRSSEWNKRSQLTACVGVLRTSSSSCGSQAGGDRSSEGGGGAGGGSGGGARALARPVLLHFLPWAQTLPKLSAVLYFPALSRWEGALDLLDAQALSAAFGVKVHLPVHPHGALIALGDSATPSGLPGTFTPCYSFNIY